MIFKIAICYGFINEIIYYANPMMLTCSIRVLMSCINFADCQPWVQPVVLKLIVFAIPGWTDWLGTLMN